MAEFGPNRIGIAFDKQSVIAWIDGNLGAGPRTTFELTEANLREEAKAQVLAAVNDAVEGMGDRLREFRVYPEMDEVSDAHLAVADYMRDWVSDIESWKVSGGKHVPDVG